MTTNPAKALFEAAQMCNLQQVKKLLADGADSNAMHDGMTPLFAVCARSLPDIEVINALLDAGADPDVGAPNLPLQQAVAMQSQEGVSALIKAGAAFDILDEDGETPLMDAAKISAEIVQILLNAGADPDAQDNRGRTALFHAIERHNKRAVEILHGVTTATESSERPWRSEKSQMTNEQKLFAAAQNGDAEFVERMLAEGVYANNESQLSKTALHAAAERGHLDVVEALLEGGADIEARDSVGATTLISAAFGGNTDIAKRLLAAGADIKATDNTGSNVLHRCVSDGNIELVRTLIDAGADVNLKNKDYQFTPLHTAVENAWRSGHDNMPAIVELLVKGGADLDAIRTKKDKLTPLHRGIRDLPTVKKMLELGANPNQADGKGTTPLMYAAELNVEHVKALLQAGAHPDLQDKEGKTAIIYAIEAGKDDVAAFLRSQTRGGGEAERPWRSRKAKLKPEARLAEAARGGDVEYVKELLKSGLAPIPPALHAAAEAGQLDVVNYLLANKADLNGRDGTDRTPLIAACMANSTPVALHLLSLKPAVKAQDIEGNTALHYCARNGNVELIKALMDAGADVDQRCKYYKNTPMHMALLYGKPAQSAAVVKALIGAGANVNLKNGENAAPLHIAACHPDLETVKLLIEAGAAVNELDDNGSTAEESARKWGSPEVAAYLQSLDKV